MPINPQVPQRASVFNRGVAWRDRAAHFYFSALFIEPGPRALHTQSTLNRFRSGKCLPEVGGVTASMASNELYAAMYVRMRTMLRMGLTLVLHDSQPDAPTIFGPSRCDACQMR